MGLVNPWHPMSDPVDIKHMGKLLEELGELSSAVSRCMIQGIDEVEPTTGTPNREWLEKEMCDVLVGIQLITERFDLVTSSERFQAKYKDLKNWHKMA